MIIHTAQSHLITGPSGVGKSTFARSALAYEGSGFVVAAPGSDELDSYSGLKNVIGEGFDDLELGSGYVALNNYLKARLIEISDDRKANKPPRYKVAVFDTISGNGQLAFNATLKKFGRDGAPPALSPDGAAFYSYLRSRQEETLRYFRAFKGYGVHIIALSHIGESDANDANMTKETAGTVKVYTPLVPGSFKLVLPSYFSTVLSAGVARDAETKQRVHYLAWKADGKKLAKSRLGNLAEKGYITVLPETGWQVVKQAVEEAAAKRVGSVSDVNLKTEDK